MPAKVTFKWNPEGVRQTFLSDGMRDALLAFSQQVAAEKEGELAAHLHAPVREPLLAARVDKGRYTYIGTVHPTNKIGYNLAKKYLH